MCLLSLPIVLAPPWSEPPVSHWDDCNSLFTWLPASVLAPESQSILHIAAGKKKPLKGILYLVTTLLIFSNGVFGLRIKSKLLGPLGPHARPYASLSNLYSVPSSHIEFPKRASSCLWPRSFLGLGPLYNIGLGWDNTSRRPSLIIPSKSGPPMQSSSLTFPWGFHTKLIESNLTQFCFAWRVGLVCQGYQVYK